MKALVVFTNENAHWLGRFLRPAYRHVYCVLPTADGCSTEINLGAKGIQTFTYAGNPAELAVHYRNLPNTSHVELVEYDPIDRHLLPMSLNNCVGLTKQLLGIRSWGVTPYQLHRYIKPKGQRMRINLTLAGGGGGSVSALGNFLKKPLVAPPPPTSPSVAPPSPVQSTPRQGSRRMGAENIRNTYGGRGAGIAASTAQALKSLMGQ